MAKLKATPKNFEQALQFILSTGKGKLSLRIGNNTYLEYHTGKGTGLTEQSLRHDIAQRIGAKPIW